MKIDRCKITYHQWTSVGMGVRSITNVIKGNYLIMECDSNNDGGLGTKLKLSYVCELPISAHKIFLELPQSPEYMKVCMK